MSSIVKENEVLTAKPEAGLNSSATAALTGEAANKPQPVALEVAVSVNGARTVEGSDKREPFSEATKTVLVFGNGAVIRLSSSVAAGQLLFLTNEKTKKEVVCQVVKSKNYRNVSGYVELEFTEPVTGFWGLRFPSDRIGSQPAPGPVAVASPAASAPSAAPPAVKSEVRAPQVPAMPKTVTPAVPQTNASVSAKPSAPLNIAPAAPEISTAQVVHMRRASDLSPVTPVSNPPAPVASAASEAANLPRVGEVKLPAAPVPSAPPAAKTESVAPAKDNSSDALKLEAARLQEQLSSLLFSEAPKPVKQAPVIAAVDKKEVAEEAAAKIFEIAKTETAPPAAAKPIQPPRTASPAAKSLLDSEEVKIPAWLEPLARNVAAPASTEELIEREKVKHAAAPVIEETPAAPTPLAEPLAEEESSPEVAGPTFGSGLAIDENQSESERSAGGSRKGILIGAIAAGVLIAAAGGTWYLRQQSGVATGTATQAAASPVAGIPGNALQPSATVGSSVPASSISNVAPLGKAPSVVPPASNAQAGSSVRDVRDSSIVSGPTAPGRTAQPAQPQPKKPALGEVHLAAPTVKHGAAGQDLGEVDPAISLNGGQITSNDDSLGGGISTANTRQPVAPAAPLPVGGDVHPAKLLASVPPSYPTLAKTQHVAGDVKVDALIDTNGRVTTMKVISGPTLLHQSAMDALRQWKYQAATLDGKPVAMHLTVTIQFRLQ
jgi:TonB family protein